MRRALWLLVAVGCAKPATPAAPDAPPAAAAAPKPAPASAPAAVLAPQIPAPPLGQRPGGPTLAACEKATSHLADLVMDSALGPTEEQRKYLEHMMGESHAQTVRYCLQVAATGEIDCVIAAKDMAGVMECGRFRREVPADLLTHAEPTQADCERFYDRLRGFRIEEGVEPAELDRDRGQVVRACQDKAKIGTLACFIASPTYAQARACP